MKKVKQKKFLGAVIGAATTLIGAGINAVQQRRLFDEQQAQQRKLTNIQNANNKIANLNELANADMSWAYDKFKPSFKCGGKKRMKANLGKYRPRFEK